MKSWIKKFQISTALDEPRSSERAVESSPTRRDDLGQFEAALKRLDQQLQNARPADAAPDDLHESIMRRVRNVVRQPEPPAARTALHWRWLTAPGFALLAVLGLWLALPKKTPTAPAISSADRARSLEVAASTLAMGRSAAQTVSAAALAPMEKEIILLRSDARRAMDLVFASLPQDAVAIVESGKNRPPL